MPDSERNVEDEVLDGARHGDRSLADSADVTPEVTRRMRWEGLGQSGDGRSSDGNDSRGDAGIGVRHDPSQGVRSQEVREALARLEMNSLEAKLFLDSIEQYLGRMEPRAEAMAGAGGSSEPLPVPTSIPVSPNSMPVASAADGRVEEVFEPRLTPPMGPTAERRRRAQGVPVERRRAADAAAPGAEREGRWGLDEAAAFARRRWIPIAGVGAALVALLLAVFLLPGPGTKQPVAMSGAGALPAAAGALAPTQAKSSADVPWAGSEPSRATLKAGEVGRAGEAGGTHGASQAGVSGEVTASSVPRSGIAAPQQSPDVADQLSSTANPSSATAAPVDGRAVGDVASEAGGTASRDGAETGRNASAGSAIAAGKSTSPTYPRVNVSSGVMAGNLVYSPQPGYPKGLAGLLHPQGEVVMQAIISRRGRVENLRVISGHYMLRGAAKDAVRTWRYRPYLVNGVPVQVATIVSVEFHR